MPAVAALIYAGLTTVGGWGAIAGSVWFAAVVEVVAIAGSYLAYQSMKGKRRSLEGGGTMVNTRSSEAPLPVLYGRHRIGGNQVYVNATGENNKYLHIVMTLSEGPIEGIETIYLDDKPASDYGSLVYYEFFNGAGDQGLCTTLDAADANWDDYMRWTSYLYIRIEYNTDKFTGMPNITVITKGRQLYDPRSGLTTYSNNPALVVYDFLTSRRYGLGIPSTDVDETSFMDAANWYEAQYFTQTVWAASAAYSIGDFIVPSANNKYRYECTVAGTSGGTAPTWPTAPGQTVADGSVTWKTVENTYTFNGPIVDRQAFLDNITDILINCRGDIIWGDGKYKLLVRKYETPVMSFDEDEIVADSFTFMVPGLADTPNRIIVKYPDEQGADPDDLGWTPRDQVIEDTDSVLLYDNEERDIDLQLIGTTNTTQANLLGIYNLERARLNKTFSFVVHPRALSLEPGDMIQVTHTLPGWTDIPVRVLDIRISQDGLVALTVQEEDAALYDDTLNLSPHTYFKTNLPNPLDPVAEATGVSFIEEEYFNKDVSYTRLKVSFTNPSSPFWDYSEVWVNVNGAGYNHYTDAHGAFTIEPVKEVVNYKVKLLSVSIQGVRQGISTATEWSYDVVGKNSLPNDVTNFRAIPQSDSIILIWDPVDIVDLQGYEIRRGTSWGSGIFLGFTRALTHTMNGIAPGTHSYMIKSADTNGMYSAGFALVSATVYGPASYVETMSELNDFQHPADWTPSTVYAVDDKVSVPLAYNGSFELWTSGTSVAPDGWFFLGTGCTVSRNATSPKVGTYSAALTSAAGAVAYLNTGQLPGYSLYVGKRVSFGCWVSCSVANKARIYIYDGTVTTTSAYHSGGGAWEWLSVSYLMPATASQLRFGCRVEIGTILAWFDGAVAVVGPAVAPADVSSKSLLQFQCATAGTSAAEPPTWPSTNGSTVADGTVTWKAFYSHDHTDTESYYDAVAGWELRNVHGGDEFVTAQDLIAGGDGKKLGGWNVLNSAYADGINISQGVVGALVINCNALNSGAGGSTFTAPFVYKNVTGDFDIETKILTPANNENYEGSGIMVRDPSASAGEDYIVVRLLFSTSATCYTRNVVANANVDDFYYAGQTHRCFRIVRTGQVFNIYSKVAETDAWVLQKTYTRVSPNTFADTVQVGLLANTGNTLNNFIAYFDYFRQAGGVLSGSYLSPVYDRGSQITRRSWPAFDHFFEGTGAAWSDQFDAIDLWTDIFGTEDTWLHLFGIYQTGNIKMKFGVSNDGTTWTWFQNFESFVVEAQGRYVRYQTDITDKDAGGYLHATAITLKEAYWI